MNYAVSVRPSLYLSSATAAKQALVKDTLKLPPTLDLRCTKDIVIQRNRKKTGRSLGLKQTCLSVHRDELGETYIIGVHPAGSPPPPKPAEDESCSADPVEAGLFQRPVSAPMQAAAIHGLRQNPFRSDRMFIASAFPAAAAPQPKQFFFWV